MIEKSHKIHGCNFRSSRLMGRASVRIRNTCNRNRAVVHDQPEHLVVSAFSEFGYGYAGLRPNAFGCDALELLHIENEESLT